MAVKLQNPAIWNPVPRLLKIAARHQARVAATIRSSAPRKPHKGKTSGPVGGSLYNRVRSRSLLKTGKAHVTIAWSELGQKLLWFNRGTSRQIARPLPLDINEDEVIGEILLDAYGHYLRLEAAKA